MTETKALLRLLFRREDVVSQIRSGPVDIRSLTEAVDVSRPTVHRSLKSLQEHDVVIETSEGYLLTTYGEFVFDRYETVLSELDDIRENRSLLLALNDADDIPESMVQGATFTRSLPFAPERPIAEIEAVIQESTVVCGFSPVVVGRYVSMFHEQLTTSKLNAEVIITTAVYDYLRSNWNEQLDEVIQAGMRFFLTDDELPFGLILAEEPFEKVCIMVYEEGTLRGVIQNDSPDAVAWARNLYELYREATTQP